MAAQPEGGHLLAIASGASVRGGAGNGVYVAAKHAIEGLVQSIAAEGREVGISVNSIGPGCPL
jgi:NAD(P)-dependent dehydrogenase (short-subunit alcohol dehydrogenase family)